MRPASPRKSSTSSGRPARPRARYLGIEVAAEPVPPASPAAWEAALRSALTVTGLAEVHVRVVRAEGRRAIVAVDHRWAPRARATWAATPAPGAPRFVPVRTWGTLVGAKAWLRNGRHARVHRSPAR
jgi:RNase P/RNase MRP subunit POP5